MAGLKRYNATTGRAESVFTVFKPLYIRRSLTVAYPIGTGGTGSIVGFNATDQGPQGQVNGELYTQASQIYIPYDGVYHIIGSLCWDNASATGRRAVLININGTNMASSDVDSANLPANNAVTIAASYFIAGGTYMWVAGFQNSGASLNVIGDQQRSFMSVVRIS